MDIREYNREVFQDTSRRIDASTELTAAVAHSIAAQRFYGETDTITIETEYSTDANVKVTRSSSFDAARRYTGKTCVLNFASAVRPGGGVENGASAQEECLCRCSTLYPCLCDDNIVDQFYDAHMDSGLSPLHNDDIIYTPGVQIIKSDAYNMLDTPVVVDVLTCAAPNLRNIVGNDYNPEPGARIKVTPDELYNIHIHRVTRIMQVANANGAHNLILGAFGCGAFRNDPKVVARAMHDAIRQYGHNHFKAIEFAVYCRKHETANYDVFNAEFTQK